MILYFKVTNSRSFSKEAALSMIATKDYPNDFSYQIDSHNIKVLKTSLVYGANASGKSNLLKAFADASSIILNSHKYSKNSTENEDKAQALKYYPNKNETLNTKKPTSYTFGLLIDNRMFEYSFSNNNERIFSESLIEKESSINEIVHFIRVYDRINNKYLFPQLSPEFKEKYETLIQFTKKENLFLSISAQLSEDVKYRIEIADLIWDFFKSKLHFSINLYAPGKSDTGFALDLIRKNKKLKSEFLKYLKSLN